MYIAPTNERGSGMNKRYNFQEFAELYQGADEKTQKKMLHLIAWYFVQRAAKSPSRETIRLALQMVWGLVLPDVWRPALLYGLSTLAAALWLLTMYRMTH